MSLDIVVPGGSGVQPGFSVRRDSNGLGIGAGSILGGSSIFGIHRDVNAALVNVFPNYYGGATGWTVYTFRQSDRFQLLHERSLVTADVLLVAGGGSGGGGVQGGGGGAGGFLDEHDVDITSGDVIVGAGGAEVAYRAAQGNQGGDSSFSGLVAHGGGYGSSQWGSRAGYGTEDEIYYGPSGGGSGGGGGPWPLGGEFADRTVPPGGLWVETSNDVAPWDRYQAYMIWFGHQDGALNTHGDQGHWGHAGSGSTSMYRRTAGGGGGSWWPAYGGDMPNGGIGRPCDIAGWFQGPGTGLEYHLYKEANWRWVPWFGGGGAGTERPNNWGYMTGNAGYGGGGEGGEAGVDGKGGGGSGARGNYGLNPGPKGGGGTAIIRIPTAAESLVEYPVPIGYEDIYDDYDEVMVHTPIYPEGISVAHVPADQPHTDCAGEELTDEFVYWGWPDDHAGDFPPYL